MWLYDKNIGNSNFSLEIGRLNFEDDRRWWWDKNLDALRVSHETDNVEITLALAQEIVGDRSDRADIAPEQQRVRRLIGEANWDWRRHHTLQFLLLHQNDGSRRDAVGHRVDNKRGDESDATLTWIGARANGAFDLAERGTIGYWLDAAWLRGKERRSEFNLIDASSRTSHSEKFAAGVSTAASVGSFPHVTKPGSMPAMPMVLGIRIRATKPIARSAKPGWQPMRQALAVRSAFPTMASA